MRPHVVVSMMWIILIVTTILFMMMKGLVPAGLAQVIQFLVKDIRGQNDIDHYLAKATKGFQLLRIIAPLKMPTKREITTSRVTSARAMAITGGSRLNRP